MFLLFAIQPPIQKYIAYYHEDQTHIALEKTTPGRPNRASFWPYLESAVFIICPARLMPGVRQRATPPWQEVYISALGAGHLEGRWTEPFKKSDARVITTLKRALLSDSPQRCPEFATSQKLNCVTSCVLRSLR